MCCCFPLCVCCFPLRVCCCPHTLLLRIRTRFCRFTAPTAPSTPPPPSTTTAPQTPPPPHHHHQQHSALSCSRCGSRSLCESAAVVVQPTWATASCCLITQQKQTQKHTINSSLQRFDKRSNSSCVWRGNVARRTPNAPNLAIAHASSCALDQDAVQRAMLVFQNGRQHLHHHPCHQLALT